MRTPSALLPALLALLAALGMLADGARAATAHDRAGLQREVAAAVGARDWCRALHYTELLETLGHEPRLVFNAAELARAAGDLATARAYYQTLIDGDPGYAKAPLARQALGEVAALIAEQGPGARCAVPPPRCGDGAVEGREACDDGNTASGDACTADCSRAPRCGDGHLDVNEMCDDGNLVEGDHCSAACLPEAAGTPRPDVEPEVEPDVAPPPTPSDGVVIHEARRPAPLPPGPAVVEVEGDAPAAPGSAVLGMSVIGGGVVVTVTGAVCALVGPLPLVGYLWQTAILDRSAERARRAQTAEEYAYEVGLSRALERDLRTSIEQWNGTGRLVTGTGLALALVGTGGIIAGAMLYRGATPDEADSPPLEGAL